LTSAGAGAGAGAAAVRTGDPPRLGSLRWPERPDHGTPPRQVRAQRLWAGRAA